MIFEAIALILFVPNMICIVASGECKVSVIDAAINAVKGIDPWKAALGHFYLGLTFLRCFGLVRHWKQFWILHTYEGNHGAEGVFFRKLLLMDHGSSTRKLKQLLQRKKKDDDHDDTVLTSREDDENKVKGNSLEDHDQQLKNAATIGTALMLINSHRALFIVYV